LASKAVTSLPLLKSGIATMEEGLLLISGEMVLKGAVGNADFEHLYDPGDSWAVAGAFFLFGVSLTTERLLALGSVPQLLQRPTPNHVRFVGVLVFSALVLSLSASLKARVSGLWPTILVFGSLLLIAPHHVGRAVADVSWFWGAQKTSVPLSHQGRTLPVLNEMY